MADVCVIGMCATDMVAYAPRLPSPGETVIGTRFRTGHGGKGANQAVQASLLGSRVAIVSRLGDDDLARETLQNFKRRRVDTSQVTSVPGGASGVAPIVVDTASGENLIVVVPGAASSMSAKDMDAAATAIRSSKVLLCQLEVPVQATLAALRIGKEAGVTTVLNTAPVPACGLPEDAWALCDVVCANEAELRALSGMPTECHEQVVAAARKVLALGCRQLLATLGARGCVLVDGKDGTARSIPGVANVAAVDTTGAGDSFLGALGHFLARGLSLEAAAAAANVVAAQSVLGEGTQSSYVDADAAVAKHAIGLIDHTSLGLDDTEEGIRKLVDQAVAARPHTAAVCVYPKFIRTIRDMQKADPAKYPRSLRVATVVNFPGGAEPRDAVVSQTAAAVADGADEVDLVINYRRLLQDAAAGREEAEQLVAAVRGACPDGKVLLKVIIESGELKDPLLISAACEAAIAGGCDFVKTSTGKVPVNATPEAAEVMLGVVAGHDRKRGSGSRPVGFKAAGGVKDLAATRKFLQIAARQLFGDERRLFEVDSARFRFGASSLLAALRGQQPKAAGAAPPTDGAVASHAIGLIDHTSLGLGDTEEGIRKLVEQAVAKKPHTAAVCVYPKFIKMIRGMQQSEPARYPRTLRVATVVNFPGGGEPVEAVVAQTRAAVADGADEVDLVINYRRLIEDAEAGRREAEALVAAVRAACPEGQVLLKVIIESGELRQPELITAACEAAIAGGCDFVKTSTGKVPVNATPEAAEVMLKAVAASERRGGGRLVGFKAAGGVKDVAASRRFLQIAAAQLLGDESRVLEVDSRRFRFGASSLLAVLQPLAESLSSAGVSDADIAKHGVGLIDHTSLGLDDTEEGIRKLVGQAVQMLPHTAAVCIYPKFVGLIRRMQREDPDACPRTLRVATVVNFPRGDASTSEVVEQTAAAVASGADEVDMVIDYGLLRRDPIAGRAAAEALVRAVRAECPRDSVQLKVIIESGELKEPALIRAACEAAILAGCDFVKTSTGKVPVNATPEAAEVMLACVAEHNRSGSGLPVGFKAAGGIKDLDATRRFLEIAARQLLGDERRLLEVDSRRFRIGASSLLASLRASAASCGQAAAPAAGGY